MRYVYTNGIVVRGGNGPSPGGGDDSSPAAPKPQDGRSAAGSGG